LGEAYRKRYESNFRQPEDFQKAVEQWSAALEIDPNQYIWCRRIQQYGPRLDKPYSFYDWSILSQRQVSSRLSVISEVMLQNPSQATSCETLNM